MLAILQGRQGVLQKLQCSRKTSVNEKGCTKLVKKYDLPGDEVRCCRRFIDKEIYKDIHTIIVGCVQ